MTDTSNPVGDFIQDAAQGIFNGLKGIFTGQQSLISILRQPTPIKVTYSVTADGSGTIGGGLLTPNPVVLWQCPESHEAWINRVAVRSPGHGPSAPLQTGQVYVTGSTSGELLFFLPIGGSIAPIQVTEGRLSAAHLNPGERIEIAADGLGATTSLRFDFQIILVTGISSDTPRPNLSGDYDPRS